MNIQIPTTGYKGKIIASGNDAKTTKGNGEKFETAIFYGKPYKFFIDGKQYNTCSMAGSAKCYIGCLNTAGRGVFDNVQLSRQNKTIMFYKEREKFLSLLVKDCKAMLNRSNKYGWQACIRLNGTTDIQFEKIPVIKDGIEYSNIFLAFPDIQFYDYTKIFNRNVKDIPNYHLTWSYSEANDWYASNYKKAIANGMNIAVVFRNKNLPKTFLGLPVINGDKDDLRFLDQKNCIVGLYAKGKAKLDNTGFVVDIV